MLGFPLLGPPAPPRALVFGVYQGSGGREEGQGAQQSQWPLRVGVPRLAVRPDGWAGSLDAELADAGAGSGWAGSRGCLRSPGERRELWFLWWPEPERLPDQEAGPEVATAEGPWSTQKELRQSGENKHARKEKGRCSMRRF